MRIFQSKKQLLATLDEHDQLVVDCVEGHVSFREFEKQYDNFYARYALDGHESDPEELALLKKYEPRIALHRDIWGNILIHLCADEDASKREYIQERRFGSRTAYDLLVRLARNHFRMQGRKEPKAPPRETKAGTITYNPAWKLTRRHQVALERLSELEVDVYSSLGSSNYTLMIPHELSSPVYIEIGCLIAQLSDEEFPADFETISDVPSKVYPGRSRIHAPIKFVDSYPHGLKYRVYPRSEQGR